MRLAVDAALVKGSRLRVFPFEIKHLAAPTGRCVAMAQAVQDAARPRPPASPLDPPQEETLDDTLPIGDMQVLVKGSGPALLFCHGFTTTGAFWREQVEPFSATHRVVVPDLPGHGRSASPPWRSYTIDAFADDLALVFRTLQLRDAVLVGLSMGGTVAQRFALRHPHLLRGLVLVGATPHGLGPDVQVDNVLRAIEHAGVAAASQAVIERSFGSAASRELVDFARAEVVQTPAFVARAAIESLNAADSRAQLARIHVPTLVVCGEEDAITPPAESRALAAGIPNAQLELIATAAHFPMLEQPARFNAVLRDFLRRAAA
jgi:3-oxoadipate enol-lactonase